MFQIHYCENDWKKELTECYDKKKWRKPNYLSLSNIPLKITCLGYLKAKLGLTFKFCCAILKVHQGSQIGDKEVIACT